jgi:hypothetical protein
MATNKKSTTKTASKPASNVTATKKKVVKKAAVKKQAVKKTAVKKTAAKKAPAENNKIKVTFEQRHKMICEAAYYISLEKSYETVNPTEDWLQAEAAINRICTVHSK